MANVNFDCDWEIDNQIRILHHSLNKPGLTLRALRQALWSLGMERSREDIVACAAAHVRNLGRPADRPQFPVESPQEFEKRAVTYTMRHAKSGPLESWSDSNPYRVDPSFAKRGTDPANAPIEPKRHNPYLVRKKEAKK